MGISSFKDSLKALEADIQHANTLMIIEEVSRNHQFALQTSAFQNIPRCNKFLHSSNGGVRLSKRDRWSTTSDLTVRTYADGKTTMSVCERKASIREFYGVIFPSVLQFQRGITDLEDRKPKDLCTPRYRRKDEQERGKSSEIDIEREEECGICMEMNNKVVLPNCGHSLCLKCYWDWRGRSQSCPFCRDGLRRVNSGDLWIYTDKCDIIDPSAILRENCKRLFTYIGKLPLTVPDSVIVPFDSHVR